MMKAAPSALDLLTLAYPLGVLRERRLRDGDAAVKAGHATCEPPEEDQNFWLYRATTLGLKKGRRRA